MHVNKSLCILQHKKLGPMRGTRTKASQNGAGITDDTDSVTVYNAI
jgi:hypothetical protein